ncbi:MAG: methylated-DNA--[protein]-cysteine S-methyltransferase [Puniceicoccaceae bacterium]
MSSTTEPTGNGLVLLDHKTVIKGKFPPLEVYPLDAPTGSAWVGEFDGKVAWLSLGDLDENAIRRYWKGEVRIADEGRIGPGDLFEAFQGQARLELVPVGTAFQLSVWQELVRIPFATTLTYGELAERLGSPSKARAVGTAVGANPIAWLIPCHRILPAGGGIGSYRWGSAIKESLLNWENQPHPTGAPDQDVEDIRKLEAMLLNAQRFEDIAKLAGHIAHDLNNLLAPIRMATELLKRKLEDDSVGRYVEIIETSTGRARAVIQEILTYARESESADAEVIDINQLLEELEGLADDTFPDTITLSFDYDPETPLVSIAPHQLHRSILNLLVNARDAISGSGEIRVKVSTHDLEMRVCVGDRCIVPGRYACISVSDTGCGISPEIREEIFDPFFTTKPKEKGTGLGLASVFGIIARSGGFIDLESIEGKGSTFHLFLPEAG